MADTRKLVTIDSTGSVTTVANLEVSGTYQAVRDSFTVSPPDPQPSMSQVPRPFQGGQAVYGTHNNGEIGWTVLIQGATRDQCLANAEGLLALLAPVPAPVGLHIEWRPDGATNSTFYEVRGPARFKTQYRWAQFTGAGSMLIDIAIPVGPLAKGARTTQSVSSFATPSVVQLSTAVDGSAPAALDVKIDKPSGAYGPEFGLVAWWPRQTTPPGGYASLLGVIEAETGTSLSGWSSTSGTYRGGYALVGTASGAGSASAKYALATNGVAAGTGSIDVEVWAAVATVSCVGPAITIKFETAGGSGQPIYTREWGQGSRPLTGRSGLWITRIGTVTLPTVNVEPKWTATVTMSWQTGSAGNTALDWLMFVPAGQRACSPTGEAIDSSYPRFMPTVTAAMSKTVRPDLSGLLLAGGVTAPDNGLGGATLEVPPGNTDMCVLLSQGQPDGAGTMIAGNGVYTGITATVGVTPRYYLVRGA